MYKYIKKWLDYIDIRGLFIYLFIGFSATLVEWLLFWLSTFYLDIHYLVATTIAMFFSTFANWVLGRLILFQKIPGKTITAEIIQIYLVSMVGWLANMFLMWLMVDCIKMHQMSSKMITTGIVFLYNYCIRKIFIYRNALPDSKNMRWRS